MKRNDESFMEMKLFCTVFKIWVSWTLGHETPTETGLRGCLDSEAKV
jgi:hypothetical protein